MQENARGEQGEQFEYDPRLGKEYKGPLAMTSEDHHRIGSTPPEELEENPGKTWAELMDDQRLLQYLHDQQEDIEICNAMLSGDYRGNDAVRGKRTMVVRNYKLSLLYLRSIGRYPKDFDERMDITLLAASYPLNVRDPVQPGPVQEQQSPPPQTKSTSRPLQWVRRIMKKT